MSRVLVVEDDESIRELIVTHLRTQGHTVNEVNDGAQAMDALSHEPFDAVVLDLMLPYVTGDDVLELMRFLPTMRVVVATAMGRPDLRHMREVGVRHVLLKPFDLDDLDAALDNTEGEKHADV